MSRYPREVMAFAPWRVDSTRPHNAPLALLKFRDSPGRGDHASSEINRHPGFKPEVGRDCEP